MPKVQFYNKRNKRWIIAEKQKNGRLKITKVQKQKAKGIKTISKKKKKKKKKK